MVFPQLSVYDTACFFRERSTKFSIVLALLKTILSILCIVNSIIIHMSTALFNVEETISFKFHLVLDAV